MGSSCGIIKSANELQEVVIPVKIKKNLKSAPPRDEKKAKIGRYYVNNKVTKDQLSQWHKILFSQESGILKNDYKLKKQLRLGIVLGVPDEYRWRIWMNVLIKNVNPDEKLYESLEIIGEPYISTIRRDLDRSFPYEAYFNKDYYGEIGQAALERVLGKFAGKHKDIGYCQGMNFIAGFLLIVSGGSEIEVFYVLEALCEGFKLKGFYTEGMPYLKKCTWVAKRLLKNFKSKLYKHFIDQELPDDLWLLKWLMTIFTMILPGSILVRVWDLFIIKGTKVLYQVFLAILSVLEPDLLAMDIGDITQSFVNIKQTMPGPDAFIKLVKSFKIKSSTVLKLEQKYETQNHPFPSDKNEAAGINYENFQLPPLKLSPVMIKTQRTKLLDTQIAKHSSGGASPVIKPSTVPVLPRISRSPIKKKSFGITNHSCDISLNGQKGESLNN
jgi:Rab-GTPase-TBC domain